ncbi:homoserine kinase [Helicobacter monodelphidis]|uniref:homoserine kinase n=1 Tax=Helicobacter sp. 15-1451 TaxID=2004995 RepID=UPI000DCE1CAE|nr:homoserine kinase [Helicobacter sp. 15-1451]RAX58003.1 homoserine kinase [Helicobacter sp. 15-1451]
MTIKVPATSANLGPGFDTLGLALSLKNRSIIKPSRITSIQVRGEGSKNPKLCVDNIFVKIFYEHFYRLTNSKEQFRFQFENEIPISRGLGSSSAVIVGAIGSAYMIAKQPFTHSEILALALKYEPHPDNITPACVGGFTTALTQKDKVRFLKTNIPDSLRAVVVVPDHAISTAYSRLSLPKKYTQKEVIFNLSRSSMLTAAFFSHRWEALREASKDKLHQNIRMRGFPILFDVQQTAFKEGALMSTLSGSGSSFFNMCYKDDVKRLSKKLSSKFPHFKIFELSFDDRGLEKITD